MSLRRSISVTPKRIALEREDLEKFYLVEYNRQPQNKKSKCEHILTCYLIDFGRLETFLYLLILLRLTKASF